MSTATNGRRREHNVRDDLTGDGYLVIRAAGSKGAVDLVAFKPGQILFVQVKPPDGANIGPTDRLRLRTWAQYADALPLVATKGPRGQGYLYRRLTGPGPKDWTPWTPDQVGTP